jgi:solute carrier family 25 folate transporter 32
MDGWRYLSSKHCVNYHQHAGAITAGFTNPFWVIKTRMCTTTRYTPNAYTGLFNGLRRLATEEGIAGLYRGMVPALFGVSHGAIQFMAYEEMKKWRKAIREREGLTGLDAERLSTSEYLVMAASSKVTATVATYPYQVLRSRFQNQTTQDKYKGVMDCIRQIHRAEGYVGFYKGLSPNIIRVLPGTCITFVVYERVAQYLRENATDRSL